MQYNHDTYPNVQNIRDIITVVVLLEEQGIQASTSEFTFWDSVAGR